MWLRSVAWLSALFWATGCLKGPSVAREVDGRAIDDRWIAPEAYAAYTEGVLLEESGDLRNAALAYERALEEDGAAEIWARLGAVRCLVDARSSDKAFGRARSKAPELFDVWLADAACALERGDTARAQVSAFRAAALAPDRVDVSLVVVATLLRAGARDAAVAWLRAARLAFPEAEGLGRAPETIFGDPSVARLLPASLRAPLAARSPSAAANPGMAPAGTASPAVTEASSPAAASLRGGAARRAMALAALDDAIGRGEGDEARRAAVAAHVGLSVVAIRAAELGRAELARDTAELVLAAEPTNTEARVAMLAAADLIRDDAALKRWAVPLPAGHDAPSSAAVRVMTTLLERRLGAEAARAFATRHQRR
jgi:tetratricopeptide (TPR) repeat protein